MDRHAGPLTLAGNAEAHEILHPECMPATRRRSGNSCSSCSQTVALEQAIKKRILSADGHGRPTCLVGYIVPNQVRPVVVDARVFRSSGTAKKCRTVLRFWAFGNLRCCRTPRKALPFPIV